MRERREGREATGNYKQFNFHLVFSLPLRRETRERAAPGGRGRRGEIGGRQGWIKGQHHNHYLEASKILLSITKTRKQHKRDYHEGL